MNNRLKKLRKTLKLTQQSFAERIGVKRNTVAQWEIGINNLSDQAIKSICREFNVPETWLRAGEGEMFFPSPQTTLDKLVREFQLTDIERRIIAAYLQMDDNDRMVIQRYVQNIVDNMKDDSPPVASQVDPQSEIAELRRQVQNLTVKIATLEQEDELQNPWSDSDAG